MSELGVEFRDESEWRGRGAPPIDVPEEIQVWMERSYRDEKFFEVECNPSSEEAREFLRLCRVYARRQAKKMLSQTVAIDDKTYLRVKMRDARPYPKPLPREKPK